MWCIPVFLFLLFHCESCQWGYDNAPGMEGPDMWSTICDDEYYACGGRSQSPIDVVTSEVAFSTQGFETNLINFDKIEGFVVNNGNSVTFTPNLETSEVQFSGNIFPFKQFHHHYPAEHEIDGKLMKLEIHFVHINEDNGVSVVGVIFDDFDGTVNEENLFLKQFEDHLPPVSELNIPLEVSFRNIFGEHRHEQYEFYNYGGSLTTPPCTEGVNWFLYNEVQPATSEQLDKFNLYKFREEEGEGGNNRPIMDIAGRRVVKMTASISQVQNYWDDDNDEIGGVFSIWTVVVALIIVVVVAGMVLVVGLVFCFLRNSGKESRDLEHQKKDSLLEVSPESSDREEILDYSKGSGESSEERKFSSSDCTSD